MFSLGADGFADLGLMTSFDSCFFSSSTITTFFSYAGFFSFS